MTKVWRKSVNRYWRYRGNIKLPRESRTHGRTTQKHIASAGAYRRRRLKNSMSLTTLRWAEAPLYYTHTSHMHTTVFYWTFSTFTLLLSCLPSTFWSRSFNGQTLFYAKCQLRQGMEAVIESKNNVLKYWDGNSRDSLEVHFSVLVLIPGLEV